MRNNDQTWVPKEVRDRASLAYMATVGMQLVRTMAIFLPVLIFAWCWLGTSHPMAQSVGGLMFTSVICVNVGYLAGMSQERLGWVDFMHKLSHKQDAIEALRMIASKPSEEGPVIAQQFLDRLAAPEANEVPD